MFMFVLKNLARKRVKSQQTYKIPFVFCFPVATLSVHGPLARYVKLRVRMRRECRERFPRHRG